MSLSQALSVMTLKAGFQEDDSERSIFGLARTHGIAQVWYSRGEARLNRAILGAKKTLAILQAVLDTYGRRKASSRHWREEKIMKQEYGVAEEV